MTKKITVDRRLWLTADEDELVEDGDPRASFLWAVEGREVDAKEAERLGYQASAEAEEPSTEGSAEETTPEPEETSEFVCEECGFEAKSARGLATHQRSHEED